MMWIGLTGGLASGKSTVARMFKSRGFDVIDADEIAKQVVQKNSEGLKKIQHAFGPGVLASDGALDRRALGRIVFGDESKRTQLENILHPLIQSEVQKIKQELKLKGKKIAFYDVPLLFEKKLTGFDAVIVVAVPRDMQKTRMKLRDQLSDNEIEERLNAQLPLDFKASHADYVINNEGDLQQLQTQVDQLLITLSSQH